jgi:hypothetical protein
VRPPGGRQPGPQGEQSVVGGQNFSDRPEPHIFLLYCSCTRAISSDMVTQIPRDHIQRPPRIRHHSSVTQQNYHRSKSHFVLSEEDKSLFPTTIRGNLALPPPLLTRLLSHTVRTDPFPRESLMDDHYLVHLFGVLSDSNLRCTECQVFGSFLLDACYPRE